MFPAPRRVNRVLLGGDKQHFPTIVSSGRYGGRMKTIAGDLGIDVVWPGTCRNRGLTHRDRVRNGALADNAASPFEQLVGVKHRYRRKSARADSILAPSVHFHVVDWVRVRVALGPEFTRSKTAHRMIQQQPLSREPSPSFALLCLEAPSSLSGASCGLTVRCNTFGSPFARILHSEMFVSRHLKRQLRRFTFQSRIVVQQLAKGDQPDGRGRVWLRFPVCSSQSVSSSTARVCRLRTIPPVPVYQLFQRIDLEHGWVEFSLVIIRRDVPLCQVPLVDLIRMSSPRRGREQQDKLNGGADGAVVSRAMDQRCRQVRSSADGFRVLAACHGRGDGDGRYVWSELCWRLAISWDWGIVYKCRGRGGNVAELVSFGRLDLGRGGCRG